MSVAPRAAPAMTERSRLLLHRQSHRFEDDLAVGAVVIALADSQSNVYSPASGDRHDDAAAAATHREQSFVAVLALSCEAAMNFLQSQPPGTFLLAKEEDAAIAVYIKFRQAVRVVMLVKGKEIKKNEDTLQLGKLKSRGSRTERDMFMQTPVHNLRLAMESYLLVEHCWTHFLPQVQAIVFELCCEPHLDEEIKLEHWTPPILTEPGSVAYSFALMPEACGFYILAVPSTGADSTLTNFSTVIQVRQVEFDFDKFAITMADGTLKPAALFLSTHFSSKRVFEPNFTFATIRDNFLSPDQVMLKETSVTAIPTQPSSLHNCIDLSSNDEEFALLSAVETACGAIMPHGPLPGSFVSAVRDMHVYFAGSSTSATIPSAKPMPWSAQKMKLVGRIIPILLELFVATTAFSESTGMPSDPVTSAAEFHKKELLAQFSHAMRFNLLFLAARSDGSVICRLVHQICQLFGARIHPPGELVDLIRDLVALFPAFLRLFLQNHGPALLWKVVHHYDQGKETTTDARRNAFKSLRALSRSSVNAIQGKGDRKMSLFGLSRKPPTKSRKSLSLATDLATTPILSTKALAFFRLSPLSMQLDLGMQLREGQFTCPSVWKNDPVLAGISFCSCKLVCQNSANLLPPSSISNSAPICARYNSRSSSKLIMYELLLQLSLRFVYSKASFSRWDRDVALLLRLDGLHQQLFNEVQDLVRRRTEAQSSATREALSCELQVLTTCLSTLYRLEIQRRQEMTAAIGSKRYLSVVHAFKAKIRRFIEGLTEGDFSMSEQQTEEPEGEGAGQADRNDGVILLTVLELFRRIPKSFLDEWMVFCLKDILQAVNELSSTTNQTTVSKAKQLMHANYVQQILQLLTVILTRTSDPDIQTILVRVLSVDCSSIISLLRLALTVKIEGLTCDYNANMAQVHVLKFLTAFVKQDVALPVRSDWDMRNRKPCDDSNMDEDEDEEVIEQLKGELLIRLIGSRLTTSEGDHNEQTLWEFMMELMFSCSPNNRIDRVARFNASLTMFGPAAEFRDCTTSLTLLTAGTRDHFLLQEAFLLLQEALYIAQDVCAAIDYDQCIASHMRHIEQYSDRATENTKLEEPTLVYRLVELHLRCLIALANRRSQSSAIHEAFGRVNVLSSIMQRLQSRHQGVGSTDDNNKGEVSAAMTLPPLKLVHQMNSDSFRTLSRQPSMTALPFACMQSTATSSNGATQSQHFLASQRGLHALAIVLVVSFIIIDPNLEIDEKICPRISVSWQAQPEKHIPSELLWTVQRHLATVALDQRYFEALVIELETSQVVVSVARMTAIRTLLRLLCPKLISFGPSGNTTQSTTSSDEKEILAREYVAKGAFSTVFRQQLAVPAPEPLAVKLVGHQKRAGELCPINGLYNEVAILAKLRGEQAATQLIDFGNCHREQNFEIVMEYCPCSLAEWRASVKRSEVSFRSCVLMILRAFEEVCHCLVRIHREGVCHFDIKGDNILVRSNAHELSSRLLETGEELEDAVSNNKNKSWLCFADFGESKFVDADRIPVRTLTFSSFSSGPMSSATTRKPVEKFISISRTRGTEAIKSPEVLKIKGSEEVDVKVTLKSDIWSLGCLLYELITQELLFQNDDWAALYSHLVVAQDQSVVRPDHKDKIFTALKPERDEEEALVSGMLELCSKILIREPNQRPTLEDIIYHVRQLANDVHELGVADNDTSCNIGQCLSDEATLLPTGQTQPGMSNLLQASYLNHQSNQQLNATADEEPHHITVPVRLFWNFLLAADVVRALDSGHVANSEGVGTDPATNDILALDAFEAEHDSNFTHFVYVGWHESTRSNPEVQPHLNLQLGQELVEDIVEEAHRTCLFLNRRFSAVGSPHASSSSFTPETRLFQQLVLQAPQYFPLLQRRLREEPGCVVFTVLSMETEDTKDLQNILTKMLLFFLQSAFTMTPFNAVHFFSRDCAQFFNFPHPEFLQHLSRYTRCVVEDSPIAHVVQCRCGAIALEINFDALKEAICSQRCTCIHSADIKSNSAGRCPRLHPFPTKDNPLSPDFGDDEYPVDEMFIHDDFEEQIVLPMESRSKRGDEVPWHIIDVISVSRVEVSAFQWTPPAANESSQNVDLETRTTSSSANKHQSRMSIFKRNPIKVGDGNSEQTFPGKEISGPIRPASSPQEMQDLQDLLIRGLRLRGRPVDSSDTAWDLYDCEFCRFPICALLNGKIAFPFLPSNNDDTR